MTEQSYYLAGIGIYLGLITWVFVGSLRARQSNAGGIADEALGTRRLAAPLIALVVAEAMLGPSDALSLSQNGLKYGLAWALFPMGAALAQVVAGLFFVRRLHDQYRGRVSIGDIFAERSGPSARALVGAIVAAQAVAFAGVLILAGGQMLQSLAGVPTMTGMLLTAGVVGAYTAIGGIAVVIDTNKLQAAFAWSLVVLCAIAILYISSAAGAGPAWTTPAFHADHGTQAMIALFVAYFMGELLLPAYSIRAMIAESGASAQRGFLLAAGLLVVWYLVIAAAGAMAVHLPPSARGATDDAVLLDVARAAFTPGTLPWHIVGALVAAGILALIHSTLNVFLNSGGMAFARDLAGFAVKSEKSQGLIGRVAVIGIALLGIVVAMSGDSIVELLLLGYTIWVPSLLPPFIWILLNPRSRLPEGRFWTSVIAGAAAFFVFEHAVATPVPGILAGFLCNLLVLLIGQRLRNHELEPPHAVERASRTDSV